MPDFSILFHLSSIHGDLNKNNVLKYNKAHGLNFYIHLLKNLIIFKGKVFGFYELYKSKSLYKIFQRTDGYVTNVPVDPKIKINTSYLSNFYNVVVVGIKRNNRDVLLSRMNFPGFQDYTLEEHIQDILKRNEIFKKCKIDLALDFSFIHDSVYLEKNFQKIGLNNYKQISSSLEKVHPTSKSDESKKLLDEYLKENNDIASKL